MVLLRKNLQVLMISHCDVQEPPRGGKPQGDVTRGFAKEKFNLCSVLRLLIRNCVRSKYYFRPTESGTNMRFLQERGIQPPQFSFLLTVQPMCHSQTLQSSCSTLQLQNYFATLSFAKFRCGGVSS